MCLKNAVQKFEILLFVTVKSNPPQLIYNFRIADTYNKWFIHAVGQMIYIKDVLRLRMTYLGHPVL